MMNPRFSRASVDRCFAGDETAGNRSTTMTWLTMKRDGVWLRVTKRVGGEREEKAKAKEREEREGETAREVLILRHWYWLVWYSSLEWHLAAPNST